MHHFDLLSSKISRVLCLGAHCDDIEIGCGATLLQISERRPDIAIKCVVFSSDDVRKAESLKAAAQIFGGRVDLEVLGFRNGYFPYIGADIKDWFEDLRRRFAPDLIFTHRTLDKHQDHRIVGELTWNTFRDHWILEYEIPKFDGDLGTPSVFFGVSRSTAERKVEIILDAFKSQADKQWFSADTFMGLMRLRGIECNAPSGFAEAFYCRKLLLSA
jgi:LmbE family N-acetylglucosaminyl deacetylase